MGVEELAAQIGEHRAFIEAKGTLAERRARNLRSEVRRHRHLADAAAARGLGGGGPGTAELLEQVVRRELDPATAAGELLERHTDA